MGIEIDIWRKDEIWLASPDKTNNVRTPSQHFLRYTPTMGKILFTISNRH